MKKVISKTIAISLGLMLSLSPTIVFAAANKANAAADSLYTLGLFNGTGTAENGMPIYELDKSPTRHEAVAMLVRLLGKGEEALNGTWDMPFTDVANWAKPYVGYAYAHGLASGTSKTTFGGNEKATAAQYITFVLRALGYQSGIDFQWSSSWTLSDALGITEGQYNKTSQFTRGDVAVISEAALNSVIKGSSERLIDQLYENSVVTDKAILLAGLAEGDNTVEYRLPLINKAGAAYGDTYSEEWVYEITRDGLDDFFGDVEYYDTAEIGYQCKTLDDYLIQSRHMAHLITSNGKDGSNSIGTAYSQDELLTKKVLFIYSNKYTLKGFFIGIPEYDPTDNSYVFDVVLCDYDFYDLYKEQKDKFEKANSIPFLTEDEANSSGAKWVIHGYSASSDPNWAEKYKDVEYYRLWSYATTDIIGTPNWPGGFTKMSTMDKVKKKTTADTSYRYFMLLDESRTPLGYTLH